VIAFADREGRLPDLLQPRAEFSGGALRLLPWVLRGPRAQAAPVAAHFESILLDTGMANADTALAAQQAFGVAIEHARHLTLHDLAALMAMQYEHAGLGAAWPLLETALMAPTEECWLDAPPEPLVRYAGGEARIALLDDEGWAANGFAPQGDRDTARLDRDFDRFQMRQRQLAALFEAHGIPTLFEHCPGRPRPARAAVRLGAAGDSVRVADHERLFVHRVARVPHAEELVGAARAGVLVLDVQADAAHLRIGLRQRQHARVQRAVHTAAAKGLVDEHALDPPEPAVAPVAPFPGQHQRAGRAAADLGDEVAALARVVEGALDAARDDLAVRAPCPRFPAPSPRPSAPSGRRPPGARRARRCPCPG
jgi:hypothetical protein